MVTPEQIEKIEDAMQLHRERRANGEPLGGFAIKLGEPVEDVDLKDPPFKTKPQSVTEPKPKPPLPRLEFTKAYGKREAKIVAIAEGKIDPPNKFRLERSMQGCNIQYRIVEFLHPVTIVNDAIFMQAPRGRDRLGRRFIPWVAFEGGEEAKRAVKELKAQGVKFSKPKK